MLCYVVNLDHDSIRLAQTQSLLDKYPFIEMQRIPAVKGSILPNIACDVLTRNAGMRNHKGALGCTLSHVLAWEKLIESNSKYAIVLEDDSRPDNLDVIQSLSIPADVDLIFCNQRLVYQSAGTKLLPFLPSLKFIVQNATGIGTDGYLVTRGGAAKLLDFFQKDGFYTHLDLRLAAYGMTKEEVLAVPSNKYIVKDVCLLRKLFPKEHFINARILGTSLTGHKKYSPSSRQAEDLGAKS